MRLRYGALVRSLTGAPAHVQKIARPSYRERTCPRGYRGRLAVAVAVTGFGAPGLLPVLARPRNGAIVGNARIASLSLPEITATYGND